MKRLTVFAAAFLLLFVMTSCTGTHIPEETATATVAPTQAPYIDTQLDEPEWTLAEGNLQLEDADNIYADSVDFLYFAIVTNTDGTQELRFKVNDETAAMLKTQSPEIRYYITLDGENIGTATLSDDGSVLTVTSENAAGELTAIATKIRGLSE